MLWHKLIAAIVAVESGGNDLALGKDGVDL